MNFLIRHARDKGDLSKERLVLYAEADIDIGKFLVLQTTYIQDGEVSSDVKNTLWLPDQTVEAGSLVVVYTKRGENKIRVNKDQTKTHFIYWGLSDAIWAGEQDCPVIAQVSQWSMKKV